MLEGLPIMLALCFMLWHAYYAQNVTGSGKTGLITTITDIHFCLYVKAALMHYPETPST